MAVILNGDGRTDLIWTNRDGLMAYCQVNGISVQGSGSLPVDLDNYEIAATGDFDGDGKADIIWTTRDRATNALLFLWRSRGDGRFDASCIAAYDRSAWLPLPDRYPQPLKGHETVERTRTGGMGRCGRLPPIRLVGAPWNE